MDTSDPTNGHGEARAREDDRTWFVDHPDRRYRLRDPYSFEFRGEFDPERQIRLVVVRRAHDGNHTRAWIRWLGSELIPTANDDVALEAMFNRATVCDAQRNW